MKTTSIAKTGRLFALICTWLCAQTAQAHITYSTRDFGTFIGDGSEAPKVILAANVSSPFGWADATDADFGDSHRTRAFRFRLTNPATVHFQVQGMMINATPALPYPAFSLYRGLCHVTPDAADHDGTTVTVAYLNSLGGVQPKEGALVALGNWKVGNDDVYNTPGVPESGVAIPASLSSLTYVGHAADGTAANYGAAPGIHGDGTADSQVAKSFLLPAGDYTLIVGGADYAASVGAVGPFTNYGIAATLTVSQAPEPIVKGGPSSALPGATYRSVYPPAVNGAGTTALRALVKTASGSSTLIARRVIQTEAVAQAETPATGTTAIWRNFGDPVINDAGEVAFNGTLTKGTGDATSANDAGVWSDLGGTLHLAWREGQEAPGVSNGHRFTSASWLNLQEGVLYLGAATSNGSVKGSGVWRWDGQSLGKVVAVGDLLPLLDGSQRTVKAVSKAASSGNGNATSRLAGSDGTLALLVTFTDGRVEVLTFQ